MLPFLIVCPLVFLAGFVDSIAGGGGLISLPAYMIAGLPSHTAIATNKLSSTLGTTAATLRFLKNGYIPVKLSLCGGAMALLGSVLGASLSLMVSDRILKGMLLVVLPVVAFYVLRSKKLDQPEESRPPKQLLGIVMSAAFLIGIYDGFYGPGTGTFLLLIFTGLGKMELKSASGTTKVINLSSNVAALITFLLKGQVYWKLGLAAAVCSVLGNYLGSGLVTQKGQKVVRPIIITVLCILFLKVIFGF